MTSNKLWETIYDDYDSLYQRRFARRVYHFIDVTDLEYNCGPDEFDAKYDVSLSEVDLDSIPRKTLDSALDSMGMEYRDRQMATDAALAEACNGYGAKALLWQGGGNNRQKLIREAKRESRLLEDPRERDERLSRPVNALGSSALEMMQGDINSALIRGVKQNDPTANLMAKLSGATGSLKEVLTTGNSISASVDMSAVKSDDPLAFTSGYMRALSGSCLEADREELAEEYIRGYQVGVEVRTGHSPVPAGVRHP